MTAKKTSVSALVIQSLDEIDDETIKRWQKLEDNAMDSNLYLSADFILPAFKYLTPNVKPIIIGIQHTCEEQTDIIALGVFKMVKGSLFCPIPHLKSYFSPHSYLSGLLIDKEKSELALTEFFKLIKNNAWRWQAIELICQPISTELFDTAHTISKNLDVTWHETCREDRAILKSDNCGENYIQSNFSKKTLKNLKRKKRRLEELGTLTWQFINAKEAMPTAINNFIQLENHEWKRARGTSLASNDKHKQFFIEMSNNFAKRNKTYFTEVFLDNKSIASTSNYISGNASFAFKLGRDDNYSKYSIGLLNELELIRHAETKLPNVEYIDSGAEPGSFMDTIWLDKRTLGSGLYALTPFSNMLINCMLMLSRLKQRLKNIKQ